MAVPDERESEAQEPEAHKVSAEEFAQVVASRRDSVTLVDLREPDEVLVSGIEGAINIPSSQISSRIDTIPKDKPVYVFCRTGDWSAPVADILAERGYDAYDVEGGYKAYRTLVEDGHGVDRATRPASGSSAPHTPSEEQAAAQRSTSEPVFVDAKGLKCPGPIVKVADVVRTLQSGQEVRVEATEDAFYSDIAVWADRTGNALESLEVSDGVITALLRKGGSPVVDGGRREASDHEKTFVIFSGDLDKTIAAFIMANGGAALGRNVTMFFTFWGLNILRKPNKVRVAKNLVERMFGAMMPRGTTKLGLSRMNMLGIGPKMIRWLMREKGIESLEELIDDARSHGVRIVACQMSMEIMGIKQEELIDGVELGGVATMLGSAERSDLTYFI